LNWAAAGNRRILAVVLLLALVLRAGFGLGHAGLNDSTDERSWDGMAREFWLTGLYHPDSGSYRPPLYPLMLSAIYQVCGHNLSVVRLWQAFLGTALCGLLYGIGRRLGGERAGLIAAGLGAVYPLFVFFTAVVMAETLLVLLTTAAVLLALRMEEVPSVKNAASLGGVLGLAALCKPVVLAWVPFLLWGWWRRADLSWSWRSVRVAVVVGSMGLVVAPWTARNVLATGYFVPVSSNLGMNLLVGNEPQANGGYRYGNDYWGMVDQIVDPSEHPVVRDRAAARQALQWIAAEPGRFARLALHKFALFWSPLIAYDSMLHNLLALFSCGPLLGVGLWGTWRLRGRPEGWIVGTLALSLSVVHMIFFAHTRFRLPIDAALIAPAAWLLEQGVCRWWPGCRK
jgi:4-amino-4-deoxy-L-arabinose transferase-like glycosyltransferase